MKILFFLILFTLLSFSLEVNEQVSDDQECKGCGGGGSSSSSSSQPNKTKKFFVKPNFIQCLKDTTAVPISIINSISNKGSPPINSNETATYLLRSVYLFKIEYLNLQGDY